MREVRPDLVGHAEALDVPVTGRADRLLDGVGVGDHVRVAHGSTGNWRG